MSTQSRMDSKNNPENIPRYDWLSKAKIFNHNYQTVTPEWFRESIDIIVLYFSIRGKDRESIMDDFYEIYENAKYLNLPIQVLNIPLDATKENMCIGYDEQANWFTLMFNDPLIVTLKYMYGITSVPHLLVLRADDLAIVSTHGILDLDKYNKNALISWLSTSVPSTTEIMPKRLSKDRAFYGPKWKYLSTNVGKTAMPDYRRKFSIMPVPEEATTSLGLSIRTSLVMEQLALADSLE